VFAHFSHRNQRVQFDVEPGAEGSQAVNVRPLLKMRPGACSQESPGMVAAGYHG